MKLTLSQMQYAISPNDYELYRKGDLVFSEIPANNATAMITKVIDDGSSPIPHIGEKISDPYWPSDFVEQKVVDVTYSYYDNTCDLALEPFVFAEGSELHKHLKEIANAHGWKCQVFRK